MPTIATTEPKTKKIIEPSFSPLRSPLYADHRTDTNTKGIRILVFIAILVFFEAEVMSLFLAVIISLCSHFRVFQMARIGSFACFGVAMECAASKCANARWPLLCPRGMVHSRVTQGSCTLRFSRNRA
jgi:hypothetical protein